ncbi:cytochrome P450 89A2-like [Lotus japonicus]|uniref:cytochrome P450 89A2-like n=1 Tax=Lotus japonicus TaxID=34305 RepID=UPI00258C2D7F|nr:cytochrome P450 89A2-like [Lotus japonicus]
MEFWLIVLAFLCLLMLIMRAFHSHPLPPGPFHIPFISNILLLRKSFSELETILLNLHAKHGPIITFNFWNGPHIFIVDPSLAHQALIQKGTIFADRPKYLSNNEQFNIASSFYGPNWRVLRRNLTSLLHPSRSKSFSSTRKRVLNNLLNRLKSDADRAESCHPIKVMDHVQHAMFSLLVFMCFGERVDEHYIRHIESIQRSLIVNTGRFNLLNFFPSMVARVLFRKRWQELLHLRKAQKDVLSELIEARKQSFEDRVSRNMKDNDTDDDDDDEFVGCYVDTLLDFQLPEEKRKLNEGEILSLCSEFLNAGTDTTSTAMEWVMANLVKHSHVQERVVEEIEGVVGERGKREVTEEDLVKLPYLKAVILEVLRLHPPSHFAIPHRVTEDVVLNGFLVPRKGTVNFLVAEMGRDPKVWEDAIEFKPERFLSDDDQKGLFDISGIKEIKIMPFGAGRRICPAYNLAMLHLEYFVANLIWNFEWKASSLGGDVDMSERQEFTMVMKHPLQALISPRL